MGGARPAPVWAASLSGAGAVGLSVAISGGRCVALRPTGPKLLEGILEPRARLVLAAGSDALVDTPGQYRPWEFGIVAESPVPLPVL